MSGFATVFTGSSWGAPVQLSTLTNAPVTLSCPTSSFCVAADFNGFVYEYAGGSWTRSKPFPDLHNFSYLSCPTPTFCAAVDELGDIAVTKP
jgi:hypothetical protein